MIGRKLIGSSSRNEPGIEGGRWRAGSQTIASAVSFLPICLAVTANAKNILLSFSPDAEIIQPEHFDPRLEGGKVRDNLVAALGVSTKYRKFSDPYVRLPSDSRTLLTKDCAAILNWFTVIAIPDDCEFLLGDVPPELMEQINTEYRKVLKERFDEPQGTLAYGLSLLEPER